MNKVEWAGINGAFVGTHQLGNENRHAIQTELKKYISTPERINQAIAEIEYIIFLYLHLKDDFKLMDNRKDTVSKLNKIKNGLKKAINALQTLDPDTQATYGLYTYLAESRLFGSSNQLKCNQDQTKELIILYEATKHKLQELEKSTYERQETPRFLVRDVVKIWRLHATDGEKVNNISFAQIDFEKELITHRVSLWLVVKEVLKCVNKDRADPSNYIQEAIDYFNKRVKVTKNK